MGYGIFGTERPTLSFGDDRQKYGDAIILHCVTEKGKSLRFKIWPSILMILQITGEYLLWGDYYERRFDS